MSDSKSYEERHAAAAQTFSRFVPDADPERVYGSFSRRQGALGSMAFDVIGEMWSREALSRRDRSLLVIAVLAAQARDEELEAHTRNGLRHGLTMVEIEEILLHVAAYAGFPAAMAASRRIDAVFRAVQGVERLADRNPAARLDDIARDHAAAEVFRTITSGRGGADPAADLSRLRAALGDVGELAYRWAFGEVWSRTELTRRDRSIVVIAILVSLGATPELAVHVPAGLAHGLSRAEIEEIVTHLALYAGLPRAVEAMRATRSAFAQADARTR